MVGVIARCVGVTGWEEGGDRDVGVTGRRGDDVGIDTGGTAWEIGEIERGGVVERDVVEVARERGLVFAPCGACVDLVLSSGDDFLSFN